MASTSPLVLSMASSEPLRAGVLLQRARRTRLRYAVGQVDVDDVAGFDERVAVALAGPLPVGGQQDDLGAG
jgi:regulator of protease activity HflC (stomatin/prohibitin superfamily)